MSSPKPLPTLAAPTPPRGYLTLQQAAERLDRSVQAVRHRVLSGALPGVRWGTSRNHQLILIPENALPEVQDD